MSGHQIFGAVRLAAAVTILRVALGAVLCLSGLPLARAQDVASLVKLTGGTCVIDGKKTTVTADDLRKHIDILSRLNPGARPGQLIEMAWAREIRLRGAAARGLTIDDDAFRKIIESRYEELAKKIEASGTFDAKNFASEFEKYAKALGFKSNEECFATWRAEALCEKYVDAVFPPFVVADDDVKKRFLDAAATIVVKAFVFAPETQPDSLAPSRSDPETFERYRKWYASVPEVRRRTYDDDKRPAVETEALTVRFNSMTPDEFKVWFETPRGESKKSIAEQTADIVPTPAQLELAYFRWSKFRRQQMLYISKTLPPGLSDEESWPFAKDHLIRQMKTILWLETIWKDLRSRTTPVDMTAEAKKWGLEYIHMPFMVLSSLTGPDHVNDPRIPGDHPFSMRNLPPGTIYDYRTTKSDFFAEGVVDQPGLHATIFKIVRTEDMRLLSAEEAADRAWADFTLDWRHQMGRNEGVELEKRARKAAVELAQKSGKKPDEEFGRALETTIAEAEKAGAHAKWFGPFYLRPFRDEPPRPKLEGSVGQKVANFLALEWDRWGKPESVFEAGQHLPPFQSVDRRIIVFPMVVEVRRPEAELFERDSRGREAARRQLWAERNSERLLKIQQYFSWPTMAKEYSIEAKDLTDAIRSEFERAMPTTAPKSPDSAPSQPPK